MNVNFGQNLAQMAMRNFMSMGNFMTQGANVLRSPIFSQFQTMSASSFGLGAGAGASFASVFGTGQMNPGFLSRPMGQPAGFAQMSSYMGAMQSPWNSLGNMFNGGMNRPGMRQIMGGPGMQGRMQQMMGQMQNIANMMNQMRPMMQMMSQLSQAKQASSMGMPGMGMPGMGRPQMPGMTRPGMVQPGGAPKLPGTGASFPGAAASDFLNALPKDAKGVAKALNVSGRRDVKRINEAVKMLKTAKPKISVGGQAPSKAGLSLSAADVQAVRTAKTPQEAKAIVMKAIGKKVGMNLEGINMKDKKGIRSSQARKALNKLLGTKVRNGREKNSGSSLALDSIAESVVKSVRGGNFGSTQVQSPGGFGFAAFGGAASMSGQMGGVQGGFAQQPGLDCGPNYQWGGMAQGAQMGYNANASFGGFGIWQVPGQIQNVPNPASGVNIDLGGFTAAANKVGELASPLIFDLEGTGLLVSNPDMIEIDIDGDGTLEVITDLDSEIGLLLFDSKDEGLSDITGADMFGDNTDLSHYGITADSEDGSFKDGFAALRALCEHFKLVDASKQYIDENDLAFLEDEIGLRMRVGGIVSGDDRRFSEIGLTQINLGNPGQTQHLEDAPSDNWGNKIIFQDGATFTVFSEVRKYADIWFKVQARYGDAPGKEDLSVSSQDIASKARF